MRWVIALWLAGIAGSGWASAVSDSLKREGVDALGQGRFAQAAERFEAAMQADPDDVEAVYLRGATANREGRFKTAETFLLRAESAGYRNPEIDFELGWAYQSLGRFDACIERLQRFERASPGRGQTSEFLGRCHLGLKQYDQAETSLTEALRRDARLASTVNLSMAAVEQARGRREAAGLLLENAANADTPAGRALRDLAGPPLPVVQPEKPLRLSLTFSVGHNSNVIGLGNTIPLPTDISRKGASYARFSAGAAYTRNLESNTALTLGYALLADRYDGISGANLTDHFVYSDLFRQVSEHAAVSLRLSGEFTTLGGNRFRDVLALRPALSYRFTPDSVTEFAYSFSDNDYKAITAPAFSRDGETRALSAVHSFRLQGSRWSGAAGLTHTRNRAQGSDFSSDSFGLSGTMRYAFPNRMVAALGAGFTRDDFSNPNSLAGGGFAFAREDRQRTMSVQLAGPLTRDLRWFAQAQRSRNRSNIAFYDYHQSTVTAGVAYEF